MPKFSVFQWITALHYGVTLESKASNSIERLVGLKDSNLYETSSNPVVKN